jgi:hypothetical protein
VGVQLVGDSFVLPCTPPLDGLNSLPIIVGSQWRRTNRYAKVLTLCVQRIQHGIGTLVVLMVIGSAIDIDSVYISHHFLFDTSMKLGLIAIGALGFSALCVGLISEIAMVCEHLCAPCS